MSPEFAHRYRRILAERESGKIIKILDSLKKTLHERPLVLYGAGYLGSLILEDCEERNLVISYICDRNATGILNGVPIINPQTLQRDFAEAMVLVGSYMHNDDIISDLMHMGFASEQVIPCPVNHVKDACYLPLKSFEKHHLDGYAWAYDFFNDDISKQTVLDRICAYLCATPMTVNTTSEMYYENGFIILGEQEIFVDGGAYDGDSVMAFAREIKSSGGGYAHIYAFEPESANFAKMRQGLSQYPDVSMIPKGLWSTETELSLTLSDVVSTSNSFVFETRGRITIPRVPVTSLDVAFAGKADPELPTFIKMDIEGAEKEALLGAVDVIKRVKSKLAICAYHKPEDVYELPKTIMSIRDDYHFCLRQHAASAVDTVLYAV